MYDNFSFFFTVNNFEILNLITELKSHFIWPFVGNGNVLKRLCHTFDLQIIFRLFTEFFVYFVIHFKATQ